MAPKVGLTRRLALATSAALPMAGMMTGKVYAAAEMLGPSSIPYSRFTLGTFEVTTLLAGSRPRDEIQSTFGMNVSAEEFASVSAEHFIPADKALNYYTPTIVNTGTELILFDTGLDADSITAVLATAGYSPDQVDIVVITHMHGDHIGGLINNGAPTFANARYVTGSVEFDHWNALDHERFVANVRPLAEQIAFLNDGDAVAAGITAMAAYGHTPGHMVYMIESGGKSLVLLADTANHYVWSLGYPDWEVRFDADKAAAAATRRRLLGMLAADRLPFVGYHMPFPSIGYVETRGNGFRYVPVSYQLDL